MLVEGNRAAPAAADGGSEVLAVRVDGAAVVAAIAATVGCAVAKDHGVLMDLRPKTCHPTDACHPSDC